MREEYEAFAKPIRSPREGEEKFRKNSKGNAMDFVIKPPSENQLRKEQAIASLRSLVKDVGISHTTLEEVFMKVTGKKVSKYVV